MVASADHPATALEVQVTKGAAVHPNGIIFGGKVVLGNSMGHNLVVGQDSQLTNQCVMVVLNQQ